MPCITSLVSIKRLLYFQFQNSLHHFSKFNVFKTKIIYSLLISSAVLWVYYGYPHLTGLVTCTILQGWPCILCAWDGPSSCLLSQHNYQKCFLVIFIVIWQWTVYSIVVPIIANLLDVKSTRVKIWIMNLKSCRVSCGKWLSAAVILSGKKWLLLGLTDKGGFSKNMAFELSMEGWVGL